MAGGDSREILHGAPVSGKRGRIEFAANVFLGVGLRNCGAAMQ
jgi:hypothetical protein